MTIPQMLAFLIIAGMMVAFIMGRWRYDLVAVCALLVGLLVGIVPFERAFVGFSNDIVIIVGSALVVSAAVARSGIMEILIYPAHEQPPGAIDRAGDHCHRALCLC